MTSELSYRFALAALLLLIVPIGAYHRFKAAASGERISHADEGYWFALLLRLSALPMAMATVAYLIYPSALGWSMVALPAPVRWFGFALGIASAWLMYWTLSSLGANLTDTVVTRTNATLVTFGPYRWVRHPYYVTAALLIVSVTLLTASLLILLSGACTLLLLALRTPKEEQRLIERFGDDYLRYIATTGRYFPRVSR
jgi:protein-S-isoprenylcysteine O-methyltransferase Ste14